MATKKKRTGLDALGISAAVSSTDTGVAGVIPAKSRSSANKTASPIEKSQKETTAEEKKEIVKSTVYVPAAVYDQWRELAFTERKKMHDYLIEGLNRVFKDRGLKPIEELTGEE